MEIGNNDIYSLDVYDDEVEEVTPNDTNENYSGGEKPYLNGEYDENGNEQHDVVETQPDDQDDSLITQLLRSKGILNPTKIKFTDESDNIIERDWNDLSSEEQFNILSEHEEQQPDSDLSDDEINLLNVLRTNNISADEFVSRVQQQAIQEYLNNQQPSEPVYEVDNISDDDLFVIDLAARVPNITDEELQTALDNAKQNPDLYKRQITGIRSEYKELEQQNIQEQQAIAQEQAQERYNEFANNIITSIDGFNELGGLEIQMEDDDKDELADFILGVDQAGISNLNKALNDPETLTKMAWFALKGQDTIDNIVDYFTNEITKVRNYSYQQGLADAKKGKQPKVMIQQKQPSKQNRKITEVEELDLYDE